MPINPNIALQVQTPAAPPNPLESLARVLQIKNAQAETQQREAQTADLQAQAQQRQRDLDSTQKLQQLLADDNNQKAFASGDYSPIYRAGVSPNIASPAITQLQTMREKAQTLSKNQAEFYADGRSKLQELIESVDPKDPSAPQSFTQGVQLLGQSHPELVKQLQPPQPGQDFGQYLNGLAVTNGLAHKILVSHTELQNKEADLTAKKNTEALQPDLRRETKAKADSAEAAAVLATAKANLLKDPSSFVAQVDSLKLPPASADRLKSQLQFLISRGQVDEALKTLDQGMQDANAPGKAAAVQAAELPGKVELETNPRVMAARTAQAVATAKALREGDNPALAGVPPAAVAAATNAATKLDLDYSKAKASADSIETVLKMAGSGNKAAGANASLVGVGAVNAVNGIKRINSAEIAQYGTAGSLLDKIQGKLQGWTEGQPIPKDVLDDMRALHQALRGSSYQQYTDGLNSINQRYGSKFGPTAPNPIAADPAMKAYADKYFGGDIQKALQYNQSH